MDPYGLTESVQTGPFGSIYIFQYKLRVSDIKLGDNNLRQVENPRAA